MEISEVSHILGDIGRRYRKSLLVVSSISFSYKILGLKITGFSAGGSQGEIGKPEAIPWILLFVTIYFFILFLWYAIYDLQKHEIPLYKESINKNKTDEEKKKIIAKGLGVDENLLPLEWVGTVDKQIEESIRRLESNRHFLYWFETGLPAFYAVLSMFMIIS